MAKLLWGLICLLFCFTHQAYGQVNYPKALGDLIYRDSEGEVYGRDGTLCVNAALHPGHVGIYLGNNAVIEALAEGIIYWGYRVDSSSHKM